MERGGAVGSLVSFPLRRLIGFWGTSVVLFSALCVGVLIATKATVRDVLHAMATPSPGRATGSGCRPA